MNAELLTIPEAEYHADYSRVSKSMLNVFADRRRLYHDYFVARSAKPPVSSRKMDLGTMAHAALLEPHRVDELLLIVPDSLLSGANKAISSNEAKQFVRDAKAQGFIPLKEQEAEAVREMAKSVRNVVGEWLEAAVFTEGVIHWTDSDSGLHCRMRGDAAVEMPEFVLGFDIKSGDDASPSGFHRSCAACGYALQDATYRAGLSAHFGKPATFYFVSVESSYPFSCAVHELEEAESQTRSRADARRRKLLGDLAMCYASGDWSEPWEGPINQIKLNQYAL